LIGFIEIEEVLLSAGIISWNMLMKVNEPQSPVAGAHD